MVSFFRDRVYPKLGFVPQSLTDTAVDSAVIDRAGFDTAILKVSNAAGVNISAGTIAIDLYEGTADDAVTTAVTLEVAIADIDVSADGFKYYFIDISGFKRYIKVTITPDLTASGADPVSVLVSCSVDLCDDKVNPASGSVSTIYRKAQ